MVKLKDIYIRDPFVLKDNGIYYLYGTTDKQAWGGTADGFKVYISGDLENFTEKVIFINDGKFWADENYWAPEVYKYNGRYYLFASFFKKGQNRRSQILVCDKPDGMFKPLNSPLTPEQWYSLDATFYVEEGKLYTVFCHEWLQIRDGEMCLARLDENMQIKGDIKVLFKASDAKWTRPIGPDKNAYVTDGPFICKLKNGKLLMLWSSQGENGYAMGMAISDKIDGDWKHINKPLISSDGGHGMLFEDKEKLFVTFHKPNSPHMAERPYFMEVKECSDKLVLL